MNLLPIMKLEVKPDNGEERVEIEEQVIVNHQGYSPWRHGVEWEAEDERGMREGCSRKLRKAGGIPVVFLGQVLPHV